MARELTKEEKQAIEEYFIRKNLPTRLSVTFDDVYIPEDMSYVRSRSEIADFSAKLGDDLILQIPFISANMESVTGVEMVTAIEREGGLGFIPQTLPLQDRLEMLELIQRTDCAFVKHPLVVRPSTSLKEAKRRMERFVVNSVILVDENRKPVGISTARDWRFERDESRPMSELAGALGSKLVIAPRDVNFETAAKIFARHKIEKLPLVDKNGRLAGLITAHGLFYKFYNPRATRDDKGRFVLCGSIGVGRKLTAGRLKEVEAQANKGIKVLLIDTARAFSVNVEETVRAVKENFPKLILVAGNVSSAKGAKTLFEWGADVVKVNQGRGYVCRTSRIGVGQPQITAIAECSVIAARYGKRIIADGGMKNPGDCVKAIIAGADVLMSGFLFVGTYESAARMRLNRDGFPVKIYEGSASLEAQRRRIKEGTLDYIREPEGVDDEEVPVTGSLSEKLRGILNGMRSAMSYFGVESVRDLRTKGYFSERLQSRAGLIEGIKERR